MVSRREFVKAKLTEPAMGMPCYIKNVGRNLWLDLEKHDVGLSASDADEHPAEPASTSDETNRRITVRLMSTDLLVMVVPYC